MSERHHAAPATDHPETEQAKKSWLDLSPLQVMGGALAAMTAAALGSRLGAEGTLVGAALASVIAAVASALYTASLRRTSAAVRGALGGRRARAAATTVPSAPVPTGSTALPSPAGAGRTSRRRTLVLSSVLGAVAIFALAGVSLTLYEAIAGQALSGGDGTTFSQVREETSGDRPTEDRSPAPTDSAEPSESPEPSESVEPTPTAESSGTPQPESAPPAEPTAEPSVEQPSAEPSATAEAEPTAPAEPSSEAPAQSQNAQTPG